LRAVQTLPPNLFVTSLAVGAFGALTGRLLTALLPSGFDFGVPRFAFAWISPLVLFVSASAAFAIAFGAVPGTRGRARSAGCAAAIATYVCHAAWIALYASSTRGTPAFATFRIVLSMFVVVGWAPILSGLFAGGCVERWQGTGGAKPNTRGAGSLKAAAFEFGLVAALVTLPLVVIIYTMAKRSRVDFAIFFPSAPFLVLVLAAVAFSLCYSMLPAFSLRGRVAGILAALATFTCFLFWIRFALNIGTRDGLPWGSPYGPFFMAFLLVGWVPLVLGAIAGAWAARRLESQPGK
jgi:hypothetical protein